MKNTIWGFGLVVAAMIGGPGTEAFAETKPPAWPKKFQVVLDNTKPLRFPRANRLPLYLWPAMGPGTLEAPRAEELARELDRRGIGLVSTWAVDKKEESLAAALAVARAQRKLGLLVNIDATPLLYSVFNGDPDGPRRCRGETVF